MTFGVSSMTRKVLVVDDNPAVRAILKLTLEQAGYRVTVASNGKEGLKKVRESRPDLVLLDIMMPGIDGWQVCHLLREVADVPIIMLTVLDKEEQIARGLNLGADDYIVKPWSNRELLTRVHAVLRRVNTSPPTKGQHLCLCGDLEIDPFRREVVIGDTKVHLTPIEFRLLTYLARRVGQAVHYSELLDHVWGNECKQDIVALRVHMHNLRQKLEKDPRNPRYLFTKHGIGYYLTASP